MSTTPTGATIPIDPEAFVAARTEANLSQYQLAEKSNLSRSFISDIEHGRRRPRKLAALTLAAAMHVTIDQISLA